MARVRFAVPDDRVRALRQHTVTDQFTGRVSRFEDMITGSPHTQCFRCLSFGHFSYRCKAAPICTRCASSDHVLTPCDSKAPFCPSCKKPGHSGRSNSCPRVQQERRQHSEFIRRSRAKLPSAQRASAQSRPPSSQSKKPISGRSRVDPSRNFASVVRGPQPVPQQQSSSSETTLLHGLVKSLSERLDRIERLLESFEKFERVLSHLEGFEHRLTAVTEFLDVGNSEPDQPASSKSSTTKPVRPVEAEPPRQDHSPAQTTTPIALRRPRSILKPRASKPATNRSRKADTPQTTPPAKLRRKSSPTVGRSLQGNQRNKPPKTRSQSKSLSNNGRS